MCRGGGDLPQDWKLLRSWGLLGSGNGLRSGAESGLVTSQETGLVVGSVKGIDERINAGTVSAVGDKVGVQVRSGGTLGGKLGSVDVESEVTVGGVVRVDEGVEVGVLDLIVVIADLGLGLWLGLSLDNADGLLLLDLNGLGNLNGGLRGFLKLLGVEGSGSLTVGGDVSSIENPETVLSGGVLDSVGLAVFADVRVLADPVAVDVGLLPEDVAVLGGEGSSGSAVAGVEPLLLQDLGIAGIDKLGAAGSDGDSQDNLKKNHNRFQLIKLLTSLDLFKYSNRGSIICGQR